MCCSQDFVGDGRGRILLLPATSGFLVFMMCGKIVFPGRQVGAGVRVWRVPEGGWMDGFQCFRSCGVR